MNLSTSRLPVSISSVPGKAVRLRQPRLRVACNSGRINSNAVLCRGVSSKCSRRGTLKYVIAVCSELMVVQQAEASPTVNFFQRMLGIDPSESGLSELPEDIERGAKILVEELQGERLIRYWGVEPWSRALRELSPPSLAEPVTYPAWLEGTWQVSTHLRDVKFPLGRKFISNTVPGYRVASILVLPNIGKEPEYDTRFVLPDLTEDVVEDRAFSLCKKFEAFWPDATVTSVVSEPTRLQMKYEGPTASQKAVEQQVDLRVVYGESYKIDENRTITAEVFSQNNLEQGLVTQYKVITVYQRGREGEVTGMQRVSAFLQDTEAKYFDSDGFSVANYDYNFSMRKQSSMED